MSFESEYLLLSLILGIAAFWRIYQLDYRCLWYDEIEVIKAAQADRLVDVILGARSHMSAPPIDYLLRHFWQQVGGVGDLWVRAYSAIWGLAGVFFTYLVGRKLFGTSTGLLAGFLLAISDYHVHYSAEVKFYVLLVALYLAVIYTWLVARQRGRWLNWIAFGLISLVGLYTHPYVAFALGFCAVATSLEWLIGLRLRRIDVRRESHFPQVLTVAALVGVLYLPWVLWDFVGQEPGWAPPELSWLFVQQTFQSFVPGSQIGIVLVLIGLLAAAITGVARRQIASLPLWLTMLTSLFLVYSLNRVGNYPLIDKQLIFIQPALLILSAGGLVNFIQSIPVPSPHSIRFSYSMIGGLAVVFFVASFSQLRDEKNPANWQDNNWRTVIQTIGELKGPDDRLIWATHDNISWTVIDWYLDRYGLTPRAEALFPWWESRVLNLQDIQGLSQGEKVSAWLFGPEIEDFLTATGFGEAIEVSTQGNVPIYYIPNLSTWNYNLVKPTSPVTITDNPLVYEVFLASQNRNILTIETSQPHSSETLQVQVSGKEVQAEPETESTLTWRYPLETPKTADYELRIFSADPTTPIILNSAQITSMHRVGIEMSSPYRAEVWDMQLSGDAQSMTDANLRTTIWQYRSGDSANLSIWVDTPGLYQVRAQGSLWGPPAARVQVMLDDISAGELEFSTTDWYIQGTTVSIDNPGYHQLAFVFSNDYSGSYGDRNALLDWVEISFLPALPFKAGSFSLESLSSDTGFQLTDSGMELALYAAQATQMLVQMEFSPSSYLTATLTVDKESFDVETHPEEGILRSLVELPGEGLYTLHLSGLAPGIFPQRVSFAPVVSGRQSFSASAVQLSYPQENQVVFLGVPAVIRYTSGPIVSARLWFSDPGKYLLAFEVFHGVPPPIEIQILQDGIVVSTELLERGDSGWETIEKELDFPSAGFHEITIAFTNDFSGPEGDRNGVISRVEIHRTVED